MEDDVDFREELLRVLRRDGQVGLGELGIDWFNLLMEVGPPFSNSVKYLEKSTQASRQFGGN